MPLYNQTRNLAEAIESLLSQSYDDFKLIVSDDSTEPGPGQIVNAFAEKDQRIIYHKNWNRKGLIDNWRNCFQLAGEVDYFAWVGGASMVGAVGSAPPTNGAPAKSHG